MSDPFAAVDLARWQAELSYLLAHGDPSDRTRDRTLVPVIGKGPYGPKRRHSKKHRTSPVGQPANSASREKHAPPILPSLDLHGKTPQNKTIAATPPQRHAESPMKEIQRRWNRVLDWCDQKSAALATNHPLQERLVRLRDLVLLVQRAQNMTAFKQARRAALDYRSQTPGLQEAPTPSTLPAFSSSVFGGAPQIRGKERPKPPNSRKKPKSKVNPKLGLPVTVSRKGGPPPRNEGFGLYNRNYGVRGGLSFEESVALRQSSKQTQRGAVDRVDRYLASGCDEEISDLD